MTAFPSSFECWAKTSPSLVGQLSSVLTGMESMSDHSVSVLMIAVGDGSLLPSSERDEVKTTLERRESCGRTRCGEGGAKACDCKHAAIKSARFKARDIMLDCSLGCMMLLSG